MKKLMWLSFCAVAPLYIQARDIPFVVIDLAGGARAEKYPVAVLESAPAGGWTDEYKTSKLVLRSIPAGTFAMGSDDGDKGEKPVHQVTISKSFFLGVFEVTQKQWELVMGSNPADTSYGSGEKYPVNCVSYNAIRGTSSGANWPKSATVDADSFVGRLQARTGLSLDLPTEAQWEYACRAGTTTMYGYGDVTNDAYMVFGKNADFGYSTLPVGSKLPNNWGLYDMHGNVAEWCLDWYGDYTSVAVTDPKGPETASANQWYAGRIIRGGNFLSDFWNFSNACSSFHRDVMSSEVSDSGYGIRLAGDIEEAQILTIVTITYDPNGGTCAELSKAVESGSTIETLPTPTRDGYTFEGWFTATEGGDQVTGGFTVESDMTLYAQWSVCWDDVFVHTVSGGGAIIGSGKAAAISTTYCGELKIPAKLSGVPVTAIADSAFERCVGITSVTIPASITNIGYFAFRDCLRLAEVRFLGNRPHVDLGAFMGVPAYTVVSSKAGSVTAVLPTEVNGDVVSVPTGWLDEIATRHRGDTPAGYVSYEAAFTAKFGSSLVKALALPTGKHDTQGREMYVWQDYVAGTDPLNEEDTFRATVTLENGLPVVRWTPELSETDAAKRNYKTYAKTALKDSVWTDVTALTDAARQEAGYQFFKVTVEMK